MVGLSLNTTELQWQKALPKEVAVSQRPLLLAMGSLTQALSHLCGQEVRVEVLQEVFSEVVSAYPMGNEISRFLWVREVVLFCRDTAVLYAVSKVAFQNTQERDDFLSGQHAFAELQRLGTRPLGYWLMQNACVRSEFEYAMLETGRLDGDFLQAFDRLPARRSFLFRGGQSLELVEVFLPSVSCED
jgi:chorismate-pyruvate lyase